MPTEEQGKVLKQNYALYYPTLEFQSYEWLWSATLLWDKIYRIVPKSYAPEDPDNVKALVEDGSIGISINPDKYLGEVAKKFTEDLENKNWNACALKIHDPENAEYVRLHKDKVDVRLKEMIIAKNAVINEEWFQIPTDFGALYMTYLAKEISEKNNLQIVSDLPAAWMGITYFKYDGRIDENVFSDEYTNHLANLIIQDFIPQNILSLTPNAIINFRNKRKDERQKFLSSIKAAASQLANCKDPKIVFDLIEDIKKDIEESLKEYIRKYGPFKCNGLDRIRKS
jgi:hypothetical protein